MASRDYLVVLSIKIEKGQAINSNYAHISIPRYYNNCNQIKNNYMLQNVSQLIPFGPFKRWAKTINYSCQISASTLIYNSRLREMHRNTRTSIRTKIEPKIGISWETYISNTSRQRNGKLGVTIFSRCTLFLRHNCIPLRSMLLKYICCYCWQALMTV